MIVFPVLPFATTLQPPLAVGQFKAQLQEAGLQCRVELFNFDFMARLGLGTYEIAGKLRGINAQIGEWLFAKEVWDEDFGPGDDELFALIPVELESLRLPDPRAFLLHVRDRLIPDYLDRCCETLLNIPDLQALGFSCLFFQTMASAALARRIKARRPDLPIVFGGASFHGEMGQELTRALPWIDAASLGEADSVIVPLFQALLAGQPPAGLQGIVWRDAEGKLQSGPPHFPADSALLESIPTPDYSEYFQLAEQHGLLKDRHARDRIFVPYETSRGCWWGQKRHCTFCGLNAEGMNYRSKSAGRSLQLLRDLYQRYPIRRYMITDNIMPHHYFDDFLPTLAEDPMARDIYLFVELKPNLTRERVRRLAAAGVRFVIPGIESLSTHLLQCLKKGATGMMSVRTLKLCREYGLMPGWSILMRIPGEQAEDYAHMADMIPSLTHFWPPFGGPRLIELHRFSPYFYDTGHYTRNIRPQNWYHSIYPADRVDAAKAAYYFDAEWNDVLPEDTYATLSRRVWQWMDIWTTRQVLPHFRYRDNSTEGPLELSDTRLGKHRLWRLDAREAALYRAIDEPARPAELATHLGESAETVRATLEEFVANRLAIHEGEHYMALALPADTHDPSLELRQSALQRVDQEAERHQKG